MEDEDFLTDIDKDDPIEETEAVEPTEPQEEVQTEEVSQGNEAPPEPVAEPVVEPKQPEPGYVPLNAVLDEREKRKALEAQLAKYQAAERQPETQEVPDMFEDPEGWQNYQRQEYKQELYRQRADFSHRLAVKDHGKETVDQALAWGQQRCMEDPSFNTAVLNNPDPVGFAVEQYQREQMASALTPDEFAQFKAWKDAQANVQAQATKPEKTVPPKSLATAPSAGGVTTEPEPTEEDIFRAV